MKTKLVSITLMLCIISLLFPVILIQTEVSASTGKKQYVTLNYVEPGLYTQSSTDVLPKKGKRQTIRLTLTTYLGDTKKTNKTS